MSLPTPRSSDLNNCFKNGILPVVLSEEEVETLFQQMYANEGYQLAVDLAAQAVTTPDGQVFTFEIDNFRKHCLLEGLDDIGLTLEQSDRSEERRVGKEGKDARAR